MLLLPGCLLFQEQVVEFEHDAVADRLTLHIAYLGLHYNGKPEDGIRKLTRAVDGNEVCLFDWWLHFQPADLADSEHPVARFLVQNVKAKRIGFFKDALGRLSAGQTVVIENVSKLFRFVNESLTGEALPRALEDADRETRALNRKAAAAGHQWLRLRGNAIELVFFASDHDFKRMKREGLKEVFGDEDHFAAVIEVLSHNTISIMREGKAVRFVLGNPKGRLRLIAPAEGREPYTPNLMAHVEKTWGLDFDAVVAPLLVGEPRRLESERVRALVGGLGAADPRRADAAARTLARSEVDPAELQRLGADASPDTLRRLREVVSELRQRATIRRFAAALPRQERIRLLLLHRDQEPARARLLAEFAALPDAPEQAPENIAVFWEAWLREWVAGRKKE